MYFLKYFSRFIIGRPLKKNAGPALRHGPGVPVRDLTLTGT
jgi:hypothetical protein